MKPRGVSECVSDPRHTGSLEGATCLGAAHGGERLAVQVGLWLDEAGRIARARFKAATCASLIGYAEVACERLEAGTPPEALDVAELRRSLAGVHPVHLDRAALVVRALRAALPVARDGASRR